MRPSSPGLDLDRLSDWLAGTVGLEASTIAARVIAGGKSNLTYTLDLGGRTVVLRRPPLGHVLATAHDMAREYRVMTALAGTNVPVPRTIALCEDTGVIGAVFYVMEYVAGTPYRNAPGLAALGVERTRVISESLVDTLVALHRVDPGVVGLGDFGRPSGFVERQTRRWRKQLDGSRTRPLPAAEALHALLLDRLPPEQPVARVVHGDFRLDNVLVDAEDRPAAVIDWEMATLGDPLTDLGLLLVYRRLGEVAGSEAVADASAAPGFLTETEIVHRYVDGTGADLSHLGFYLGLGAYKLAAILEGIHYRYQQGQTVGDGFDGVGAVTEPLLDLGVAAMTDD